MSESIKLTFKHDFAAIHHFIINIKLIPHKIGFHRLEEDSSIHTPPFLKCEFCGATFNSYGVCVQKPFGFI